MERINLKQGSPEWHEHRSNHFNASDAPAMMGYSKYKTRNKLIEELATGIRDDVNPATQKIFDKGHRFEKLARSLAEEIIGEDLFPVVGKKGGLSASFDGLTMMENVAWEHKTLNAELAEIMVDGFKGNDLPLMYRVQMEQQALVSDCERILFTASKWDDDDELIDIRHCWYEPDDNIGEEILSGWIQLEDDIKNYTPSEAVKKATAEHIAELPALYIEIEGDVKGTNLATYEQAVIAKIRSINTDLVTDDDFATAEATIKFLSKAEKETESVKKQALAKTASIEELFRTVDNLREEMRKKRLELNKLVEECKKQKKMDIALIAKADVVEFVNELNKECGGYLQQPATDFNSAMKGKKLIESLQSAADDESARAKVEAKQQADKIKTNLLIISEHEDYSFLLSNDISSLVHFETAHLKSEIKARISDYDKKEQEKIQIEKDRAKQAEIEKQAAIDAAEKQKAEFEEREKQAKADKEAAEILAKQQAEQAAEDARLAEIKRQEEEKARIAAETARREANKKHISKIRKEAKESLIELCGLSEDDAKKVVIAIHDKQIKNVQINY